MGPVRAFVKSVAGIAAVVLLAAACSSGHPQPAPKGSSQPSSPVTAPTPTTTAGGLAVQIWFTMGNELFETTRSVSQGPAVGTAVLDAVLRGPTPKEAAAGVATQVPGGTQLLGLTVAGGIATVSLNDRFSLGQSSTFSQRTRLAQIVFALTQFPTVKGVRFELDGSPILTFDRKGAPVHRPSVRQDYEDLVPAILVDQPTIGERVSSPITVSGTADVFEAAVSIRILDQNGQVLTDTFATATCGTGCRGTYWKDVSYKVGTEQPGTVMLFEASAENGKMLNVVKIPVTLSAS